MPQYIDPFILLAQAGYPVSRIDPTVAAGASIGRLVVGIGTTAMGALAATQNGQAVPFTVNDIYAPITGRGGR